MEKTKEIRKRRKMKIKQKNKRDDERRISSFRFTELRADPGPFVRGVLGADPPPPPPIPPAATAAANPGNM